jgi:hypothetical protein
LKSLFLAFKCLIYALGFFPIRKCGAKVKILGSKSEGRKYVLEK